jgi:hypothetical protein
VTLSHPGPAQPIADPGRTGGEQRDLLDREIDSATARARDLTRAADLLQALASPSRLRTLQAASDLLSASGRCTVSDLAAVCGTGQRAVVDDLIRLQAGELVTLTGREVAVDLQVLGATAEALAAGHPVTRLLAGFPDLTGHFRHGRLVRLPEDAERWRRVAFLVVELVPADVVLTEEQVNRCLHQVHDDHAALRRLLVDQGLLRRGASRSYLRAVRGGNDHGTSPD